MSVLCSVLLTAMLAGQAGKPAYQITGTVHSARDGSPIGRAHLRLTPANNEPAATSDNSPHEVFSNDQGRFQLPAPGPGRWVITASASGFYQQGYLEHEQFQSALVLSPGTPTLALDLRLEPDASVTGTVLDEAGEPVRDAQVSLFPAPLPDSELNLAARGSLQTRTTDDLGHYDLSGLASGTYRLAVSARPWYASVTQPRQDAPMTPADALDVVYPMTWYPGVVDAESAATLALQAGDTRQADFSLLAVPATHLRVPSSITPRSPGRGSQGRVPQLDRIPGSTPSAQPLITFRESGRAELSGLTPGLYRIRPPGNANTSEPLFLRVTSTSPSEIDLSSAVPATRVGVSFLGLQNGQTAQVTLTDVSTGARFDFSPPPPDVSVASEAPHSGRHRFNGRFGDARTLDVPAGRYRVNVSGDKDAYLTSIEATGASVDGNLVDIRDSAVNLRLHVETGPATVRGFCLYHGQPIAGAMVVLVPASLGQTGSIPLLLRDQSDSDGSFFLPRVVPGPYILVAIQDGWKLNWRDPATLQRFLLNGIALAPVRGETLHQRIEVQFP